MPQHLVLLGDSIFDNAAYVEGKPDVIAQLRSKLPVGSKATLLAVDGAKAEDVIFQLENLPKDATHLFVSAGGNNAIQRSNILGGAADSVAEALEMLSAMGERFERNYHKMLQAVLKYELPTVVCTIYYPNFSDPHYQKLVLAALTLFNETILGEAIHCRLPIIDLRATFDRAEDYANALEPSERGGDKMTNVMLEVLKKYDFNLRKIEIFF